MTQSGSDRPEFTAPTAPVGGQQVEPLPPAPGTPGGIEPLPGGAPATAGAVPRHAAPQTAAPQTTDSGLDADQLDRKEQVKAEGAALAGAAGEESRRLATEAKAQATDVAQEARRQVGDLVNQAQSRLLDQAGGQQQRAAVGVRSLSEELSAMVAGSEQSGPATDLAHTAAVRLADAAQWLENGNPGTLVADVRRFARRRPGTFLAIAAGAGLVAGRLTRGLKDNHDAESQSTHRPAPAPASNYPPPAAPPVAPAPVAGQRSEADLPAGPVANPAAPSSLSHPSDPSEYRR